MLSVRTRKPNGVDLMADIFEYLNDITHKKVNIMADNPDSEKGYKPYTINKFLSQHSDTLYAANAMNALSHLPHKLQFDFFINIIRKKFRRAGKWLKKHDLEGIDAIKEYYNYSNDKAREAIHLLTDEQVSDIKSRIYKGGLKE
tara:strand:+ start:14 stop:445 length:432 start_codon:yes stop_codon:yes gene_type:complete